MFKSKHSVGTVLIALIALVVIINGESWVQMKVAVKYAAPFEFVALRTIIGALSLFLVIICLRKPIWPKEVLGTFLLGSLQTAGLIGFATWALVSGGAGKTAVLVYSMPFWVLFLAWPLLGERIRGMQWIAIILGLGGLLLILGPLNVSRSLASGVLAILAAISWAMSSIIAKKLRQKTDLDVLSLTAWQMLFGSIILVVIALLAKPTPIVWSGPFIGALVYTAIPATAVVFPLWFYVLNKLSAGAASIGTLATPVVGVLFAWLQLGERPGFAESIGMLLILIALFLISLQSLQQQQHGYSKS